MGLGEAVAPSNTSHCSTQHEASTASVAAVGSAATTSTSDNLMIPTVDATASAARCPGANAATGALNLAREVAACALAAMYGAGAQEL